MTAELEKSRRPPPLPVPVPRGYDRERIEANFWPKFKRAVLSVPGLADVLALYYYMNSDRAPMQHKVSILATLAYFIMPLDAIPDFLGAMGYTDDVAVALGLIKFIGSDIMRPYRIYARRWLKSEVKPDEKAADARG
jgi:uncharacterized membrane protein YkvA (DUF1232 family)